MVSVPIMRVCRKHAGIQHAGSSGVVNAITAMGVSELEKVGWSK